MVATGARRAPGARIRACPRRGCGPDQFPGVLAGGECRSSSPTRCRADRLSRTHASRCRRPGLLGHETDRDVDMSQYQRVDRTIGTARRHRRAQSQSDRAIRRLLCRRDRLGRTCFGGPGRGPAVTRSRSERQEQGAATVPEFERPRRRGRACGEGDASPIEVVGCTDRGDYRSRRDTKQAFPCPADFDEVGIALTAPRCRKLDRCFTREVRGVVGGRGIRPYRGRPRRNVGP